MKTVAAYPSDERPGIDGVIEALSPVSLFEKEDVRCYILDGMALQYYGSKRVLNVSVGFNSSWSPLDVDIDIINLGLADLRVHSFTSESNKLTQVWVSEVYIVRS